MELGKSPPILETRNVLLDHLVANVIYLVNDRNSAREISFEISKNLSNKDVFILLENKDALKEAINKYNRTTDVLGEKLFSAVSEVDSGLCAQITGMLLELNVSDIENLLSDTEALVQAVRKAKTEYLKYLQKNSKTTLGEELYDLVLQHYPNRTTAAHLTGMLLELDVNIIKDIISNPSQLSAKLDIAYKSLSTTSSDKK